MHVRFNTTTTTAMLLGGIAALHALLGVAIGPAQLAPKTAHIAWVPAFGGAARIALDRCRENVMMIHDVYWAAACTATPDDSPECTLPADRARELNAARGAAEERCLEEAMAAERVAGRPQ